MKLKVIIYLLFLTLYSCSSQSINKSDLTFKGNLWYLDNNLYSGEVYQIVRKEKKILGKLRKGVKEDYWVEFGSLIWRQGAYVKGNKDGSWNGFYIDSTKAFNGAYENGLKVDLWNGWNKEGVQIYRGQYIEGKKNGIWVYKYDNGQVSDSGEYKNDLMSGQWKYWFENGSLMKEGSYNSNGQEILKWLYYDIDGMLKKEKEYINKN